MPSDPLWYKDAVIYELHVRSFKDSDDDGFGDFEGLRRKLPYLESLGVNTLWLLPFLKSPLKDDGYDIADFLEILPVHGDLAGFQSFLDEAHARGMRVITELVLNHTSDQHPWFQEARNPESDKHDWYVWSRTTEKYAGTRIIFTDTEVSNWTWDRQAGQYYWHRFFSHQPDLNYDNPAVREAMKEVMFYWFDLGVDGLRLDAVPYLYEREGTNSENLPETIAYIKRLRAAVEERYGPGKILLAEANQWPEDTLPYFGEGDGVQMAFNFPVMPRLYMALRRETRRPLVEMLELTNDIPAECQWAIFLRNHDELTLEMVTDEERDYMVHEYAADPRFRINVGIRRRLAPLLGGERKRIELMNALLLSLKGSPVLYYGDEIGMGDDPFLGDRNGVRTPMQWSADKNGGFSRAPHYRLFMPPINRGPYSYEFVNVEDAETDEHSLLHFTRRLLALRKQHEKVFGRGTLELLPAENQSVLAFVRAYEGEQILVVANLSRYAQSVQLAPDAARAGMVPVELFGQTPFPPLPEEAPYHLMLGAHAFYWFALKPEVAVREETQRRTQLQLAEETGPHGRLPVLHVQEGLENLLVRTMARGRGPEQIERLLPDYLATQRWFGSKERTVRSVEIADAVRLQAQPFPVYLTVLRVALEGSAEAPPATVQYVLPLAVSFEDAARVLEERPNAALAWIDGIPAPAGLADALPDGRGLLHDATATADFWAVLFRWWQRSGRSRSLRGLYTAQPSDAMRGAAAEPVHLLTGEQSNSSAILDSKFFIKLYRRLEQGVNPETELLTYLTEADFTFVPHLHGTLDFRRGLERYALGILQEALPVEIDGWGYALDMMDRFMERVSRAKLPADPYAEPPLEEEAPVWLDEVASEVLALARTLGIRTAELHGALARAEAPALRPEPMTTEDLAALADRIRREAETTRALLSDVLADDDPLRTDARWQSAYARLDALAALDASGQKIRIHGDYHLGQVLRADGEYYILDFEGEPARALDERRTRDSALRDVAGMLRSLEYAALAAWREHTDDTPPTDDTAETWTTLLVRWSQALFTSAYTDTAGEADFLMDAPERRLLLWAYLLDKVLYEVRYELSHRPTWRWLPLLGLRRLLAGPASAPGQSPTREQAAPAAPAAEASEEPPEFRDE